MKLRKITSWILGVIMLLSLSVPAFAAGIEMEPNAISSEALTLDEQFVTAKIKENHGITVTPTVSYHLLDTSSNPTYTCVEFSYENDNVGYGILDLCSYELVLYSLDKLPIFDETDVIIYSGALDFAAIQAGRNIAVDLLTQETVSVDSIQNDTRDGLSVKNIAERETFVAKAETKANSRASENEIAVSGAYDEDLVYSAGNNSGTYTTDCGINAIAMYLRHLDDYYGGGYLLSTLTTESKLKISLAAYTTRTLGQLTNLTTSQLATISNGYTNEHGTSHTSISSSSYTWTKLKNTIDGGAGVPCILRVGAGATSYWTSAHFVIGVEYTAGATSTSGSIRVNSGWTSLGYVYIGTSIPSHIVK